jgi:multiple sugar transport system substrate-binding protein
MRKGLSKILSCTLALSLMLTGCGAKSNSANKTEGIAENKAPVYIRIAYYGTPTESKVMDELIEDFEKDNPDIDVENVCTNWGDHFKKLNADIAAGNTPELFILDSPFVEEYASKGASEDLTERIKKEINTDNYYGFKELALPDGRLFGIPKNIYSDILYYNKDMFDKAGISYPNKNWTMEDLREASKKLSNGKQWGFGPVTGMRNGWFAFIKAFGGDVLDKSRQNSTIASDPMVKEAVKFIYDMMHVDNSTPNFKDMEGELTAKADSWTIRQKVAMWFNNNGSIETLIKAGLNYDVSLQPLGKDGHRFTSAIPNVWSMSKTAAPENKEAAWKFLKFYLTDEIQRKHISRFDGFVTKKNIANEFILKREKPENMKAFIDSLEVGGGINDNGPWLEWQAAFTKDFTEYLKDNLTLDQFIEKADKDVQAVLDEYYKK